MTYKRWMKDNLNFPLVITTSALLLSFIVTSFISENNSVSAATSDGWSGFLTGTIIDVDPMTSTFPSTGYFGLFFEMDNGKWIWLWKKEIEGKWPNRNQKGTFYKKKIGKSEKYKWVVDESTPKTIVKKSIPGIVLKPNNWKVVIIGIPPVDKTVLVRYKNGKTITTAYVNSKKEWKLETSREKVLGGKTIKTIKEWKEISR